MVKPPCSIDGCETASLARGWCSKHYSRWSAHGDPLKVLPAGRPFPKGRKTQPETCEVAGCTEPTLSKGMCRPHWAKEYRKANRERLDAYNSEYDAANPAVRAGISRRQHEKNRPAKNAKSRARRQAHPEDSMRYWQKAQDESLKTALRSGYIWAGWEMERASDLSFTAPEIAKQLGRTVAAVRLMRHKISHDPQTIQRAGLSESGHL